ncbi:MAG: hypothetical protein HKP48_05945 [Winogradskyella sp.]|uniref:hypothetical protein n=1 Tax=Winogradskyella sp. TaxID=1883156 RepID=UPI0017E33552|nr:hypothetical protein [Winogradskyella sp.]MBT8244490.1 hypothetical protein [Winogradskyella sp.]NNK22839.1 hypothetical protein [Winogradskyella sp.]
MKRLIVFILLIFTSCNYLENKKVNKEDIVSQELETIDWNAVDAYPSFSVCDNLSEKQERKLCFESTILNQVNEYLSQQSIVVSEDIEDTISMKLQIDKLGKISILEIKAGRETRNLIPEIDTLLQGSIKALPKIYPAVKRGQHVTTEFVLPVVVSIE